MLLNLNWRYFLPISLNISDFGKKQVEIEISANNYMQQVENKMQQVSIRISKPDRSGRARSGGTAIAGICNARKVHFVLNLNRG